MMDNEQGVAILAYLVCTGRIAEAAQFIKDAPRLRQAVLKLARLLLDMQIQEGE